MTIRTPGELALLAACAKCGAVPDAPCMTTSGVRADMPHASRMRVVFETQAEQYAEDVHFMQPNDSLHRPDSCSWCKRGQS